MLKLIVVSDPLRNSRMTGGAIAARFTCQVRSFSSLLEGLPGWIMYISPCGAGYCGSSTRGTVWIARVILLPAEGCVGGGGAMIAGALGGCGIDRVAAVTAACLSETNSSASLSNSLQSFNR